MELNKQNEIKEEKPLLNEDGELTEKGYSKKMLLKYDRKSIKANKLRIKEWDYYLIYNDKFGLALTVADNSYMGLYSATFFDFAGKKEITKTNMKFMTLGKTNMPSTTKNGDVEVKNKKYSYFFENAQGKREINVYIKNFYKGESLIANIKLTNEPEESMVIATPFWEKKKAFYYNQKIIGFKANGIIKIGTQKFELAENSFGLLDWGRGVWPHKSTWYWGAGIREIGGKKFGFNIGYGFGDTTNATENMLFYEDKAHKLNEVRFNIPKNEKGEDDYLKPWTFTSNDGRFEMNFTPILDRHSKASAIIISSNQHQVFGRFSGKVILDDGRKIEIKNFLGFAEKVANRW